MHKLPPAKLPPKDQIMVMPKAVPKPTPKVKKLGRKSKGTK
jgi:hypothetical protein